MCFLSPTLTLLTTVLLQTASAANLEKSSCYCIPGDSCWPTQIQWSRFNNSVGGRLITSVQLGAPCHFPYYDKAKCEWLQANVGGSQQFFEKYRIGKQANVGDFDFVVGSARNLVSIFPGENVTDKLIFTAITPPLPLWLPLWRIIPAMHLLL